MDLSLYSPSSFGQVIGGLHVCVCVYGVGVVGLQHKGQAMVEIRFPVGSHELFPRRVAEELFFYYAV